MKLETGRVFGSIDDLHLDKVTAAPYRIRVRSSYGLMVLEATEAEAEAIVRGWLTEPLARKLLPELKEQA